MRIPTGIPHTVTYGEALAGKLPLGVKRGKMTNRCDITARPKGARIVI